MNNWKIEEIGDGNASESCFLIIDFHAEMESITECCVAMFSPEIKHMHIVFDNRIKSPFQIQKYLQSIQHILPDIAYTVKHATPFVIQIMHYLWNEMHAYYQAHKHTD